MLALPRTRTALDNYTKGVAEAISKATAKVLPLTQHSPKAREWWDDTCAHAIAETKRLRRVSSRNGDEESWEAYRIARNQKTRIIKKALRQAHRDRVEEAAGSIESLWKLAKWARTRENQPPSVTPAICNPETRQEATEAEDKAELFRQTFFPAPPKADLEDIQNAQYPDQIVMPKVTEKEVQDAIKAASPLKAPGPDGISNRALQAASNLLAGHLTRIINQSLKLGYCPKHFRSSTTVVLRKPGKDNYTIPKAYRPIALLNTMGKIMDAVIARRLSYLVEEFQLIPDMHMGGRKLRSTEHALQTVIQRIYDAWNRGKGQVASLLLLDVSGAFDNVSHQRLLHNLRKRRVDESVVRWIASFLTDRNTRIVVDGFESNSYTVETGVPQGSPLSPILYIFYNSDLIEECDAGDDTAATGYIDDAAILAWGDTTEETCAKLESALTKANRWATTHASKFAPEKFQLTHFTRSKTRIDRTQRLRTANGDIAPKATCKYLGVVLDSRLRWKAHIEEIRRKATKTVNALSSLGSSTWGLSMQEARKIYRGVVVPQMMYAGSIWSNAGIKGKSYTQETLRTLQSIQARGARAISGAFRATSRAALDVETHLLPMEQQIWKHNAEVVGHVLCRQDIPGIEIVKWLGEESGPRRASTYTSPLQSIWQDIKKAGATNLQVREQIPPFVMAPWSNGPGTHIAPSDDEARSEHDAINATQDAACIYTDGSSTGGHIGCAAVWPNKRQTESAYMGTADMSTVYAAELQGINMALDMVHTSITAGNSHKKITVFADNQAAIRSLTRAEGRSGAYIVKQILGKVKQLRDEGTKVNVRWIPAHEGIDGNEAADRAAKEATGWREDGQDGPRAEPPSELYALRSTLKTWSRKTANKQWQVNWAAETKGSATRRHTPIPTKKVLQLHKDLSKRESAILVQMRTEKIGLKDFLFQRRVPGHTDSKCDCGSRRQTVAHILLDCRKRRDLRRQELGRFPGRNNLRAILNTRKLAIKAIKFMEQTRILGHDRIENA
jgi:ribonuclease HI